MLLHCWRYTIPKCTNSIHKSKYRGANDFKNNFFGFLLQHYSYHGDIHFMAMLPSSDKVVLMLLEFPKWEDIVERLNNNSSPLNSWNSLLVKGLGYYSRSDLNWKSSVSIQRLYYFTFTLQKWLGHEQGLFRNWTLNPFCWVERSCSSTLLVSALMLHWAPMTFVTPFESLTKSFSHGSKADVQYDI